MKKQYENVYVEIVDVKIQDIITTSEPDDPFNGEEQPFVSML